MGFGCSYSGHSPQLYLFLSISALARQRWFYQVATKFEFLNRLHGSRLYDFEPNALLGRGYLDGIFLFIRVSFQWPRSLISGLSYTGFTTTFF